MASFVRPAMLALAVIVATLAVISGVASPDSAERSYVGQETCMSSGCHATAYHDSSDYQGAEAFRATLHQKIHFRPTPETVVMDHYFEGDSTLRLVLPQVPTPGSDTLLIDFWKSDDGSEYWTQMRISGGGDVTPPMKIEYTYGGYGWAQRYLVRVDDNFHVLPFQYALPAYGEHSDTSDAYAFTDLNRWLTISSGVASFIDQSSGTFRGFSYDRDCAACHVNGFNLAVEERGFEKLYSATWVGRAEGDSALTDQNMRVGCESCHGPGSEHAAAPSKQNIISPASWPSTREGTDLKLDLCNGCHTRGHSTGGAFHYAFDETSWRPYVPGQPLTPFYRLQYGDMVTWPDRVTSFAHHQKGQDYWRSKHYASHVFQNGCWDCHTVHTNGRDGLPYQLKENYYALSDGEGCLTCHGAAGAQMTPPLENMALTGVRDGRTINLHTQHTLAASQCVDCHFPRTATISAIDLPRKPAHELTQHDFRVRPPSMTLEYSNDFLGMMNTCAASCHRNGRGSRNFADSTPVAPSFGILDRNLGGWKEASDLALADTLWRYYQIMYEKYVRASIESSTPAIASKITSIAPNPVGRETRISFTVASSGDVALDVFDTRGRFLRSLAGGRHPAGAYSVIWDATTGSGSAVSSGVYVVRLRVGAVTASCNVIVERR
jgi:hypothetical protein